MESKYDRVDVPDNLYLHYEGEREDCGTGVYPSSVIPRKYNFKDDTVKVAGFKMRRTSGYLFMIGGLVFLVVLVPIIVIAADQQYRSRNHDDTTKSKSDVTTTLIVHKKTKGITI